MGSSIVRFSKRGMPLLYVGPQPHLPTITMENYMKWYWLHLLEPDGSIREIDFTELESAAAELNIAPFCDHVPNPVALLKWAADRSYEIHDIALEAIIGRWEREYHGRY